MSCVLAAFRVWKVCRVEFKFLLSKSNIRKFNRLGLCCSLPDPEKPSLQGIESAGPKNALASALDVAKPEVRDARRRSSTRLAPAVRAVQ